MNIPDDNPESKNRKFRDDFESFIDARTRITPAKQPPVSDSAPRRIEKPTTQPPDTKGLNIVEESERQKARINSLIRGGYALYFISFFLPGDPALASRGKALFYPLSWFDSIFGNDSTIGLRAFFSAAYGALSQLPVALDYLNDKSSQDDFSVCWQAFFIFGGIWYCNFLVCLSRMLPNWARLIAVFLPVCFRILFSDWFDGWNCYLPFYIWSIGMFLIHFAYSLENYGTNSDSLLPQFGHEELHEVILRKTGIVTAVFYGLGMLLAMIAALDKAVNPDRNKASFEEEADTSKEPREPAPEKKRRKTYGTAREEPSRKSPVPAPQEAPIPAPQAPPLPGIPAPQAPPLPGIPAPEAAPRKSPGSASPVIIERRMREA